MKVYTAPQDISKADLSKSIFLAGSIEMGKAEDWQKELIDYLKDCKGTILNPRRNNWDDSWEQKIENKQFREQVEWELDGLEKCRLIVLYFDKDTKSPISLLELGLYAKTNNIIVYCPDGFYRKGNVDIVCSRNHIPVFTDFKKLKNVIKLSINQWELIDK